ncbi:hypothetical protein [Streptomyces sp. ALI-76-A]|jgi:uncharacterized membrane protein YgcG|uniref:hypothetical protein n=1 Tax=Streptomyces sp. ALI-76-A TaxID=3025736 RepID=UPI00256ED25F|nr:hypothetical protein [Streptomyces sp. ALI-76-A]MDL5201723.1 hypothetical protein [Streptomyces sp. ALI-76-A]
MSGPRRHFEAPPAPGTREDPPRATTPAHDSATDVVRWAAFSCVLVPVVLLWYGSSLAGAAGTALGLAAVTAVCRILLRRSEHGAARLLAEERARRHAAPRGSRAGRPRPRHHRAGTGAHRGGRRSGGNTPVG